MSSQSNLPFEATGGARIGMFNASWPFARLTARSGTLKISVRLLGGDYLFTPDTVVSITRHTVISILGWGVQIQHCHPAYPARFIFWSFGNPDALLAASGNQVSSPGHRQPPFLYAEDSHCVGRPS